MTSFTIQSAWANMPATLISTGIVDGGTAAAAPAVISAPAIATDFDNLAVRLMVPVFPLLALMRIVRNIPAAITAYYC